MRLRNTGCKHVLLQKSRLLYEKLTPKKPISLRVFFGRIFLHPHRKFIQSITVRSEIWGPFLLRVSRHLLVIVFAFVWLCVISRYYE
jgi:hypothetical protein